MDWHYAFGAERRGPVDEGSIETLVISGTITRDTLVWKKGMSDWVPAHRTALTRYFSDAAPPKEEPAAIVVANPYAPPVKEADRPAPTLAQQPVDIPIRHPAAVVALSLVTCGVYRYALMYQWSNEINRARGYTKFNAAAAVVSTLLTCGFAAIFWDVAFAQAIGAETSQRGTPGRNGALPTIAIVAAFMPIVALATEAWPLFYFPILTGAFIQAELNRLASPNT